MKAIHTAAEVAARPLFAMLRSAAAPVRGGFGGGDQAAMPFVTISRQFGAGATAFAQCLVERLNRELDAAATPWRIWDRELVETVSRRYQIPPAIVAELEEHARGWLEDFLVGLQCGPNAAADELSVFHRLGRTVRALAAAGHTVIVGRGGCFVTRDLPGGVHVRLVAPFEYRVARVAAVKPTYAHGTAAQWVREKDIARDQFHLRYGPRGGPTVDSFDITLNTASAPAEVLAEMVMPLIRSRAAGSSPAAAAPPPAADASAE